MSLRVGIGILVIGGLSFCAALAFADWRWLLITIPCCIMVRAS